jgi:prephenate dehydratase
MEKNKVSDVSSSKTKIAFLGPRGTFCEQAALKFSNSKKNLLLDCKNISDIFRMVENKKVDYGVVPIENSTEGSVNIALDLLLEKNIYIAGEIMERISHNLITKSGIEMNDIRFIFSHPQAIAQCRIFLEKNLPNVQTKEASSTASAVKEIKDLKYAAAIGSILAAETYDMDILVKNIEDNPNNFTRFFILAKNDCKFTGSDKTSIIFSVKHIPGALYEALGIFANKRINLTKIESRPTKDKPWEYIFFCDFEGHRTDIKLQQALRELGNKAIFLKILGSYPKFEVDK